MEMTTGRAGAVLVSGRGEGNVIQESSRAAIAYGARQTMHDSHASWSGSLPQLTQLPATITAQASISMVNSRSKEFFN